MPIRNINIRRFLLAAAVLCVSLLLVSSPRQDVFASLNPQTTKVLAPLDELQRVDSSRGWVLTGGQLFWTDNQGADWSNITPPDAGALRAAFFVDQGLGFAVAETFSGDQVSFSLFTTTNQGAAWQRSSLASYPLTDPRSAVSRVHLQFLNSETGWVVLKRATSINFNLGTVFRTTNGGASWTASAGPAGEAVSFYNSSVGFMTGGPNRNILYRTTDGGQTWSPTALKFGTSTVTHLPRFLLPEIGNAAVVTNGGSGAQVTIYQTADLGASWTEAASTTLSAAPIVSGAIGEIKAFSSTKRLTFWQITGQLESQSVAKSENFTQVSFADSLSGWALANQMACQTEGNPDSCTVSQALLQSADGGLSWQTLDAPQVYIQVQEETDFKFAREVDYHRDRTAVWTGQGIDMCEIASASTLQNWKNNSPFSAINLYIGGVSFACDDSGLTKQLIKDLSQQGWKFIPTWVGPQAYCSIFQHKMSSNLDTARQQGKDNANDASAVLEQSGLGGINGAGSVVYYDLEGFPTSNSQCLAAAKAFIDGWVWQLHQNGITAGLYGSACASGLSEFYTIANPPDVIWPAAWYNSPYYRSFETTNGIPCLSDSQWGNRQRILQYTGAHDETWGGITLHVDLNVINGVVADITNITGAPSPAVQLLNGSFEEGILAPWQVDLNETACASSVINDSNTAQFGNHYLSLSNSGSPDCLGISQPLTFTPLSGEQYRFAVWARSASPGDLRSIRLLLTADGPVPTASEQPVSGIGGDWVCLEVVHNISRSDHTGIIPSIVLDDEDGIDVFLDTAQLTRNTTGSLCPTIPIPSRMEASDAGDQSRVILLWDSVPGATFYRVFKSTTSTSPQVLLDRSLTNKFIETSLPPYETAYYSVQACNAGGCSKLSSRDAGSLADPNLDFFDGFEDGNLNLWNAAINSPADVYACTAGSLNGAYGLCVKSTLTSSAFLVHNLPAPTRDLTLDFTFDPNSVELSSTVFNLVKLIDTVNNRQALTFQVIQAESGYRVRIGAQEDSGEQISTTWVNLPDQPAEITLIWRSTIGQLRNTSGGFSEASLQINGIEVGQLTGLSNHSLVADRIMVGGLVNAAPSGTSGIYYLDDINYSLPLFLRPNDP